MGLKENIKIYRKSMGIKQIDFAKCLGVSQKDISRWENGERTPNVENLKKICEVLNTSADIMLDIKLDKERTPTKGES